MSDYSVVKTRESLFPRADITCKSIIGSGYIGCGVVFQRSNRKEIRFRHWHINQFGFLSFGTFESRWKHLNMSINGVDHQISFSPIDFPEEVCSSRSSSTEMNRSYSSTLQDSCDSNLIRRCHWEHFVSSHKFHFWSSSGKCG